MSSVPPDHGLLSVIGRAADIYQQSDAFWSRSGYLIFVCGAAKSPSDRPPKLREQFLPIAASKLPESLCLLAEEAVADIADAGDPKFVNLALFEKTMADIADIVVLFSESPGSYAELGYFCAKPAVIEKMIVARDRQYENSESFINVGMVDLVQRKSVYTTAINIDSSNSPPDFSGIFERITNRAKPHLRRRPFEKQRFSQMPMKQQFVFVHMIVNILRDATYGDIVRTIKAFCGDNKVKIDEVFHVLCATGLIIRDTDNPSRITYNNKHKPFIEFKSNTLDELKVLFAEYHERQLADAG